MKSVLFSAALITALSAALASGAQSQPRPPGPGPFTRPIPIQPGPQTPIDPRNGETLRPLPTQTELRVETFRTSGLRCNADLSPQSIQISARLPIQRDPVQGDQARIDILVDGVSQGERTLTASGGFVTFSQRVPIRGGTQGDHEVVFVLNGAVRSAPQAFPHSCATLQPSQTERDRGVITRPNLAFGDLMYVAFDRNETLITEWNNGRRTDSPVEWSLRDPTIVENATTNTATLRLTALNCTREVAPGRGLFDHTFAIAIRPFEVDDPVPHVSFSPERVRASPPRLVDTRDGARWATGAAVGSPEAADLRGTPLPEGHLWLVFSAALGCTRDGTLTLRWDGGNRLGGHLRESNETDNELVIRYATLR